MTDQAQEIQVKEKKETTPATEPMREGMVFAPAVDIFETDREIAIVADMPGVKAQDLTIDLRESILTLSGQVNPLEQPAESCLLREYRTGQYYRQFTLSDQIDQGKIEAKLTDGVLRLILPKAEKAKPRQINVQTA